MRSILLGFLPCFLLLTALMLSCTGPSRPQENAGCENLTVPAGEQPAINAGDNTTPVHPAEALPVAEEYDRAIAEAASSLEANAENITLKEKLADAYIARAWYYKVKRLNPSTLADLSKAVDIAPGYYRAYYELGRFHNNQWQFSIGRLDLDKALSLKPDFAPAYSERAYSDYKNRKYESGLADANRAIDLDQRLPRSYCVRSLIYAALGRTDLAIQDANQAVHLAPDDAASYYNRSMVYTAAGEPALAIADLETTLKLSQDDLLTTRAGDDLRALNK
ncbi:MAG: tetratricopeptide repeat protein [Dehalococcoidia bacterium]